MKLKTFFKKDLISAFFILALFCLLFTIFYILLGNLEDERMLGLCLTAISLTLSTTSIGYSIYLKRKQELKK